MEFRRSGGRDERRRRVLRDETTPTEDQAATGTSATSAAETRTAGPRSGRHYAAAAKCGKQKRLSDLIPRKAWFLALLTCGTMLLCCGIVALAWYAPQWQWLNEQGRAKFSANQSGNLASWFASLLMLLSAAGTMQIYLLRRHKLDDYRGRYRLWPWIGVALLLASANSAMGLHEVVGTLLTTLLPAGWRPSLQLAVLGPIAMLVTAIGIRLAIETRQSYGTLAALACTAVAYMASMVITVRPDLLTHAGLTDGREASIAILACQQAGHALVLLTTMLYGRYVLLVANGLIAVRVPRERKPKPPKKLKVAAETTDSENPASQSTRSRKTKTVAAKAAPAKASEPAARTTEPTPKASISKATATSPSTLSLEEMAEQEDLTEEDTAHLSKAERRRLRKLQRRSNKAA